MNQPLVEPAAGGPDPSEAFTQMALRIKHNSAQPFGGAVVIYPPAGGGEPVEFLLLDNEFPRAVRYSIGHADRALHRITGAPPDTFSCPSEQQLGLLKSELAYARCLRWSVRECIQDCH